MKRRKIIQVLGMSAMTASLKGIHGHEINTPVPEASNIIRLLYNENPNGPSEEVKKVIVTNKQRSNRYCTFHQYDYSALKRKIADQEGLKPENVLLGHGSFQPLTWLAIYYGQQEGEILVPSTTFDVIGSIATDFGYSVRKVALTKEGKINLDEMSAACSQKTTLVTICNPNNPTGSKCDDSKLKEFCLRQAGRTSILIDEAYIHYIQNWRKNTMSRFIRNDRNIFVARTFSKIYGMAGLRIGYLLGPKEIIAELETTFSLGFPGNMPNTLSVAAAYVALDNESFIDKSRRINDKLKQRLYKKLGELEMEYFTSETNFVFFNVQDFVKFKSFMKSKNIILAGGWPSHPNWARVTISNKEEMDYFISNLEGRLWLE